VDRKNLAVIATTTLLVGAVGYFWLGAPDKKAAPRAVLARIDTRIDIGAGATLYAQNCASCHGDKLQGQPNWKARSPDGTFPAPPHDETGHTWHHDDALLFSYTKNGGAATLASQGVTDFASGMPGFGQKLSDQEIRDILGFIASTWPDKIKKLRAKRLANGG